MRYLSTTTSDDSWNVIGMALASLFLLLLPFLPEQVLATNPLTHLPVMTFPGDWVDPEWVAPRCWNLGFFALLRHGLKVGAERSWSGWFLVSVATALVMPWLLHTRRPAQRPGQALLLSSAAMLAFTLAAPPWAPRPPCPRGWSWPC